jgi:hypothetical protein
MNLENPWWYGCWEFELPAPVFRHLIPQFSLRLFPQLAICQGNCKIIHNDSSGSRPKDRLVLVTLSVGGAEREDHSCRLPRPVEVRQREAGSVRISYTAMNIFLTQVFESECSKMTLNNKILTKVQVKNNEVGSSSVLQSQSSNAVPSILTPIFCLTSIPNNFILPAC